MATIVVGGSRRGVGKTTLVCGLIAALPEHRWTAVKITSHDHGKQASIWEETEAGQGTDTARYLAAGATRAFLITASEVDIGERLAKLRELLGPEDSVIYESNRVVGFVRPDVCMMAIDADEGAAKASFLRIAALADAMVSPGTKDSESEDSVASSSGAARPRFVLAEFERISLQMIEWLRGRIAGSHNSG